MVTIDEGTRIVRDEVLSCFACKQPIAVGHRLRQIGTAAEGTRFYHEACAPERGRP